MSMYLVSPEKVEQSFQSMRLKSNRVKISTHLRYSSQGDNWQLSAKHSYRIDTGLQRPMNWK